MQSLCARLAMRAFYLSCQAFLPVVEGLWVRKESHRPIELASQVL